MDAAEARSDAQVGREIDCNIPHELSPAAKCRIGEQHAATISVLLDVPVGFAWHKASKKGDKRNEHYHFIFPTRDQQGRKLTALSNRRTSSKIVAHLRGLWQRTVNRELRAAGLADRLDLRSRAARGLSEACQRISKVEYERARRGKPSLKYARNQAILHRRAEQEAHADTGTRLRSTRRIVAAAQLLRRASRRRARSRGPGGTLDYARRRKLASGSGFPAHPAKREGPQREATPGTPAPRLLAAAGPDDQRQPDVAPPAVVGGGASGGDRRGDRFAAALAPGSDVGDRPGDPEHRVPTDDQRDVAPAPEAESKRGLAERAVRWLTRADQREARAAAEAQAQAEADRRHEEVAASMVALNERIAAREAARAKREQDAIEAGHASDRAAKAELARVWQERVAAGIEAVATSEEELVRITTEAGNTYHMRREEWVQAQDAGAVNVPLCSEYGHQVQPGEKDRLRVSTVVRSVLEPYTVPSVDEYLAQPEEPPSRRQGPSLGR